MLGFLLNPRLVAAAIFVIAGTLVVPPPVALAGNEASQAEYHRLSREMGRLAERNAWSGVERSWESLLATGVPPSQADLLVAAQAAKIRGDVGAVRQRLSDAAEIGENREVLDWLWEIDSNYGQVSLAADPGTMVLEAAVMPFAPDLASSVRFAQALVAETGSFDGYLPAGEYTFGQFDVRVVPRVQSVRIDARGGGGGGREGRAGREPRPDRPARSPESSEDAAPDPAVERPPARARTPRTPVDRPVRAPRPPRASHGPSESVLSVTPSVGAGNLYGGQMGPGAGLLLRADLGGPVLGVSAGVGYDVPFALLGWSVTGRLYSPELVLTDAAGASLYAGAGYMPLVYWTNARQEHFADRAPVGLAGLEVRLGKVSVDGAFAFGRGRAGDQLRWWPAYGVGLGFKLP